jgi:tRNA (Thr-GGU) A37 N-methylase
MPIQSAFAKGTKGYIGIFDEYVDGLKDLDQFSHLVLLCHFHLSHGYDLTTKPFLDETERGIFAIRLPRRPNPIGISVIRLEDIKGNILNISEVDINVLSCDFLSGFWHSRGSCPASPYSS